VNNGSRGNRTDRIEHLIGREDVAPERNGSLAQLEGQVTTDETIRPCDEYRSYRSSLPAAPPRSSASSSASRWARMRF
jgi:hypothetical protein